jgi:uncharacterized protein YjiS (DUF1127 family)
MTTANLDHRATHRSVSLAHIFRSVRSVIALLPVWAERASNRRQLRDLLLYDHRLLQDIGLRREDIMNEAFKAFWRE